MWARLAMSAINQFLLAERGFPMGQQPYDCLGAFQLQSPLLGPANLYPLGCLAPRTMHCQGCHWALPRSLPTLVL